jgi:hypothetical protein
MRTRIGSTIAVIAATIGLAGGVAGPVYAAFGGDGTSSTQAARIMRVVMPVK